MLNSIEEAIGALKQGEIIIVVDSEDRENEGDFVALAQTMTPQMVNMMITYGKGMVCVPITQERAKKLKLTAMVDSNDSPYQTAFTVTVDAIKGLTTGISATERCNTIRALSAPESSPQDFCRPGHIFPLIAKEGGVLKRPGHTEAACDLARLCGSKEDVGVICEILQENGEAARLPQLQEIAKKLQLKIISIKDLIAYRLHKEKLEVWEKNTIPFPTAHGDFKLSLYEEVAGGQYHLAITKGDFPLKQSDKAPLVRIHSECFTGDLFGSLRCDCGPQLEKALELIENEGLGAVIYLKQEGRGIGAANKIRAYALQDKGHDTVEANHLLGLPADSRSYEAAAAILTDLKVDKIRLLTNNPAKIEGLTSLGIDILERVPIEIEANAKNRFYLETKKERMGHLIQKVLT